ncbi:hypothetical protein [Methylotuvimicrobium alcaliphilum]|uniref:Uncharacterized protein n=1 Tax=Methylotuvimicrobium alcaliphilum (strain DSM 19304 / NCIMB 14124 / VKM B-2133 / 20Z) TaxID=1091494 RepID=G4T4K6_META2|nr:hypothetical protein [Methylotuvimicrobium alcaliphilum]CCE25762.1 protein of unknown function [Methylotuvimicrobium alcaliphilum 20Z]
MLESLSTNKLCLSLEGWIIQSGERCDIEVNQVEDDTAIEFSTKSLKKVSVYEKKAIQLKQSNYQIIGEVVFRDKQVIVIDVGFFIFQNNTNINLKKGDWCTGEVCLGFDPFPIHQYINPDETIPNIYYDMKIDRILLDETPFIQEPLCAELGLTQSWVTRDRTREKFTEIVRTDAKRRHPFSEFIVECTLLKHSVFEPWTGSIE